VIACLILIASILEKELGFFRINIVDLSGMDDLVEGVVFLPASIPWHLACLGCTWIQGRLHSFGCKIHVQGSS